MMYVPSYQSGEHYRPTPFESRFERWCDDPVKSREVERMVRENKRRRAAEEARKREQLIEDLWRRRGR